MFEIERNAIVFYTFSCSQERIPVAQNILHDVQIEHPPNKFSVIAQNEYQLEVGKQVIIGLGTAESVLAAENELSDNEFDTQKSFQWTLFKSTFDA